MPLATLVVVALLLQAPAGWDATYLRGQQLMLDKKTADAIKLFESVVKASPTFDGAHYALGDAHHMLGLEAILRGPSQDAAKRRHLEAAAKHFRLAADRKGEYQQLAVGNLMRLYGEDELNQPEEVVIFARQYIQLSPTSSIGHITLARALKATGREAAATAAFLQARSAVPAADALLLATTMVDYAVQTKAASTADLKAMLDYADTIVDRGLKEYPKDRQLIVTKGASALFRAQRLETDPARKRASDAEASRMMDRLFELRDKTPVATPAAPPGFAEPDGYAAARTQAEGMMSRKQFSAAAGVYEKFVKSNPEFVEAHYFRVRALVLAGQGATIDASLKAARQAIPAAPEVRHMAASYELD
jgi:tetratricopeptide (TPR) repeat protein